jgi:hypothetical protein
LIYQKLFNTNKMYETDMVTNYNMTLPDSPIINGPQINRDEDYFIFSVFVGLFYLLFAFSTAPIVLLDHDRIDLTFDRILLNTAVVSLLPLFFSFYIKN